MLDSKILYSILGVCVAAFAICQIDDKITEGFLGNLPSMKTKVWRSVGNDKGDFYSVPGTYQSMLAPRNNGSVDYGANIRYNVPSYKNLAVPRDPLSFMDLVKPASEGYQGSRPVKENFTPASCVPGGTDLVYKDTTAPVMPSSFASGNFNMETDDLKVKYPEAHSILPVGNMTTINASGEVVQPVVYDRFVYANRNSRLRSQGDPIRGDLPIVPCAAEWFRPSVHPQIDLQEGAMNVMGGMGNETTRNLSELLATTSAGTTTTVAGIDLSNDFTTGLGAALGDVITTAYP